MRREDEISREIAALVTANNAASGEAAQSRLRDLKNELQRLRNDLETHETERKCETPRSMEEFEKMQREWA